MKRMIIAGLVLVGLLVAADFAAAAYAESAVSRQMRAQLGLTSDPAVRINGFPFLTQAIAGRYTSVDVTAPAITIAGLRGLEVRAHLEGVQAPLSELIGPGPHTIEVEEAVGTVRIGPRDLEKLIPAIDNLRIENVDVATLRKAATQSGDPALARVNPARAARLVGDYTVIGRTLEVSAIVVLRLDDNGRVVIEPRDLRVGGASGIGLPSVVQSMLRDLFTVRIDTGNLPLEITPDTFQAVNGLLEVSGTTTDLVLGPGAASSN